MPLASLAATRPPDAEVIECLKKDAYFRELDQRGDNI